MKTFTRIEPTTVYEVGDRFKQQVVVKRFRTEDGLEHEFTTFFREGAKVGDRCGLISSLLK
jgi:Fe2+ or Zn2+ uptake regulation protein